MRLYNALPLFPFFQKIIRDRSIKKRVLFPALLSIELTNYCNARCIMCPRGKMTREKKHMDFSLFKKIILDSQNHPLKKINLFWFGEPLVYSRFLEALSFIKKTVPGVKVNISTNGGLLNRDISEKIVRENLASSINIDLDGMKKETAEKIRPGTKFEEVLGNIDSLLEMKTRYRDSTVKVSMTIIEMEENKEEISAFYAYWKKRVKQVNVNNYNTWGGNVPGSHSGTRNRTNGFDFPCE
ncbi:MAG: radical SAM protein, partial [Nitrospinota bacterium]